MFKEYLAGKKHGGRGAEISDTLDSFEDAGYILTESDLIIDIDTIDHNQIRELLVRLDIKTETVWTTRGAHLYFKKPLGFRGATGICALGFEVEYKHMSNTKDITVKQNGVERQVDNRGIRQEFPDFFKKGRYETLLGLDDGDGRNNLLFAHRVAIRHVTQWKQVLRFINEVLFSSPLDENEMELLLRHVDVEATKDGETLIAETIMREHRVVKFGGHLYHYEGNEYISDEDRLIRLVYRYCEGQKTRYVEEVIRQMDARCKLVDASQTFPIKFTNGVLRDGAFVELDYTDFTPYAIKIDYKADAEPVEEVDQYLNQLTDNDPDYRLRLLETLGHCLITNTEFKRMLAKFFIFVGDGGNGKGTLLTIIRSILETKNCSALSIKNMSDERYVNVLAGKLANLGDDVHDEPINNEQMKMLKNISTSDYMETRKLFQNSQSVEMTVTLIFTSNHILKSFEKSTAYKRRVDWLPMYTKPVKKDPKFITKLTTDEALEYWIRLIVEGYFRLYEHGKFTDCHIVEEFNDRYHSENNTAIEYIEALDPEDILGRRSPEIYDQYEVWCEENGLNVQSPKLFKSTVVEIHRMDTKPRKVNGKSQRVFVKLEDNEKVY